MTVLTTVVFADISGSVALYETLGNERAAAAVAQLTQWISVSIQSHSGRVVKKLGDGVLGVFGDAAGAALVAQDGTTSAGFVTDFSWGYRLRTAATYRDVMFGTDFIPSIAWSHDVDGWSPEPGQAFNEGRQSIALGLGLEFDANTKASVSYVKFVDSAEFDVFRDRDFISFTGSYSF